MRAASLYLIVFLASCSSAGGGGGGNGPGGSGGSGATGGSGTGGAATPDARASEDASGGRDAGSGRSDGPAVEAAPVAADCFPECIARIRRSCQRPQTGTCKHDARGEADIYCYSNGVKETKQAPPFVKAQVVVFTAPGGAPCYSTEVVSAPGVLPIEEAFKDATGREVARGTHGIADGKWTIACDGASFMVDEFSSACDTVSPGQCTDGACP